MIRLLFAMSFLLYHKICQKAAIICRLWHHHTAQRGKERDGVPLFEKIHTISPYNYRYFRITLAVKKFTPETTWHPSEIQSSTDKGINPAITVTSIVPPLCRIIRQAL